MVYCWYFHLVKNIENQEGLLYGDYVGSLLDVVIGVIIGISVVEPDGDKVGRWLRRILGTVLNIELGNFEGFSLYWSLNPIPVCALVGWCITNGYGTEMIINYWCPYCVWIFFCCVMFGNQTRICLILLSFLLVFWPSWLNNNKIPLYNIPCVCIVPSNSTQTSIPVNHYPQPISKCMQSPLLLGLLQQWQK